MTTNTSQLIFELVQPTVRPPPSTTRHVVTTDPDDQVFELVTPRNKKNKTKPFKPLPVKQRNESKDPAFQPFWNNNCSQVSQHLWWPTSTNCTSTEDAGLPWKNRNINDGGNRQIKDAWSPYRTAYFHRPNKSTGNKKRKAAPSVNKRDVMRKRQKSKAKKNAGGKDDGVDPVAVPTGKILRTHKIRLSPNPQQLALLESRFEMKRQLYNLVLQRLYERVNGLIKHCLANRRRTKQLVYDYLAHACRKYKRDKNKRPSRIGIKKQAYLMKQVDHIRALFKQHESEVRDGFVGQKKELMYTLLKPLMNSIKLKDEFVTEPNISARSITTKDACHNRFELKLRRLEKMAPRDIRLYVVDSLVKAFEANVAKRKLNPRHRFCMKYKDKKSADSISMEYKSVKLATQEDNGQQSVTIFSHRGRASNWQIGPIPMAERFCADSIKHVVSISRYQGVYYLLLTFDINKPELLQDHKKDKLAARKLVQYTEREVALDPGVRKAFTYYSPEGSCGYLGIGVNTDRKVRRLRKRLVSTQKTLDLRRARHCGPDLQKKMQCKTKRSRRRKRRAMRRYHARITNYVDDCQWKTCHWLLSRYQTILLPKLGVNRMVKKQNKPGQPKRRKLSSRTCQDMLTLGHGKILSRVIQKVPEYTDRRVVQPSEAYSSVTCGCCGQLHDDLGDAEVFACPNPACLRYHVPCDRDLHAARNIYIRWLVTEACA